MMNNPAYCGKRCYREALRVRMAGFMRGIRKD